MVDTDSESSFNEVDSTPSEIFSPLSAMDISDLQEKLLARVNSLDDEMTASKTSLVIRKSVKDIFHEYSSALNSIACGYIHMASIHNSSRTLEETIRTEIRTASNTILKPIIEDSIDKCLTNTGNFRNYAKAVGNHSANPIMQDRVCVANGPSIPIPSNTNKSIYIGPIADKADSFRDSEATKIAVLNAINPSDVDLKIVNMKFARQNSIRLDVQSANIEKLKSSVTLKEAGLEIKDFGKLRPRLLVRFVPADVSEESFLKSFFEMNTSKASPDSAKIFYVSGTRK